MIAHTNVFNLQTVHASWLSCLQQGLSALDSDYVKLLSQSNDWLPGPEKIFNAFSQPIASIQYVLFGESPYPRKASANGYAFWDAAVHELWSQEGLSKQVNRATSLRNLIKMLLVSEGLLHPSDTSQAAIAALPKDNLVKTNDALFKNLLNKGFLLLNTTPVLSANPPAKDAKAFSPFIKEILACLLAHRPQVTFILLGRIANQISHLLPKQTINRITAEHPYNLSFITNPTILSFFQPLHLLSN